jgi:hypothetical protein
LLDTDQIKDGWHHGAVRLDDQSNPKEASDPSQPVQIAVRQHKAARAANNGALPPDLSLVVNAR